MDKIRIRVFNNFCIIKKIHIVNLRFFLGGGGGKVHFTPGAFHL